MKREIIVRGKKIDNGDWVFGCYTAMIEDDHNECFRTIPHKTCHRIWQWEAGDWNLGGYANYEVIPETVGQFTGLKDKNGIDIYEGDIVQGNFHYTSTCLVKWNDKRCGFYFLPIDGLKKAGSDIGYKINSNKVQIIGNIHDNPELLIK